MYRYRWEEAWGVRACGERTVLAQCVLRSEAGLVPKRGTTERPHTQPRPWLPELDTHRGFTDSGTAERW